MFGPNLSVTTKTGAEIMLRPFREEDMPHFAEGVSNPSVKMWTTHVNGLAVESEYEWFEKTRKSESDYHWSIVPAGQDKPIGVTGLTNVHAIDHACISGIIIFDKAWWGRGVAGATHIARTWYASNILNITVIKTTVFDANIGSRKALESVGYVVTGIDPCEHFRDGSYHDLLRLRWFNPNRTKILFPKGVPKKYRNAIEKAKSTLEKACSVVTLL